MTSIRLLPGGEAATERLDLRRPRLADLPDLFAFLGDPAAMEHTHVDPSLRDCRRRIAAHAWRRRIDGAAPWTVIERATGRIVGWGGLYVDPFDLGWGMEVGYFLHPEVWGRGYATELVRAATHVADHVLRRDELYAFAKPENQGSRRVLAKAGFEVVRYVPEMERHYYRRPRATA
jgi:[ribosomal protein S5]-alanine N-acetyltransferase